jgi:hypothetical protein
VTLTTFRRPPPRTQRLIVNVTVYRPALKHATFRRGARTSPGRSGSGRHYSISGFKNTTNEIPSPHKTGRRIRTGVVF